MDDVWNDRRVITIDLLGDEFLETVQMGDPISIHEDGTVEVEGRRILWPSDAKVPELRSGMQLDGTVCLVAMQENRRGYNRDVR